MDQTQNKSIRDDGSTDITKILNYLHFYYEFYCEAYSYHNN